MVKAIEVEEQAPPTELEVAVAKAEAKIEKMKHIDARNAVLDYIFPLLRKLAAEAGDQDERLHDLAEQFADMQQSGDADVLEAARDMIIDLASLLDQTMVAAGFCVASKKDDQIVLAVSEKMPETLRVIYEKIGPAAAEVMTEINAALADDEGDDGDEDEDDEEDEHEEDTNPIRPHGVSRERAVEAGAIAADGGADHVSGRDTGALVTASNGAVEASTASSELNATRGERKGDSDAA